VAGSPGLRFAAWEVQSNPGAREVVGSNPTDPTMPSWLSADVLRTFNPVSASDFAGTRREMSPNRPHHHFAQHLEGGKREAAPTARFVLGLCSGFRAQCWGFRQITFRAVSVHAPHQRERQRAYQACILRVAIHVGGSTYGYRDDHRPSSPQVHDEVEGVDWSSVARKARLQTRRIVPEKDHGSYINADYA